MMRKALILLVFLAACQTPCYPDVWHNQRLICVQECVEHTTKNWRNCEEDCSHAYPVVTQGCE